jgi:hypothetical protein
MTATHHKTHRHELKIKKCPKFGQIEEISEPLSNKNL